MTLAAVVLFAGCKTATPFVVTGYETLAGGVPAFRHCTVTFNSWVQDIIDECGQPIAFLVGATKTDEVCAIYETNSRSFGEGAGTTHAAVCMTPSLTSQDGAKLRKPIAIPGFKGEARRLVVRSVFALASPPQLAPTAQTATPETTTTN
jgi:hypothetical protein